MPLWPGPAHHPKNPASLLFSLLFALCSTLPHRLGGSKAKAQGNEVASAATIAIIVPVSSGLWRVD